MAMRNPIHLIPADAKEDERIAAAFAGLMNPSSQEGMEATMKAIPSLKAQYPPLERLTCAKVNLNGTTYDVCNKPGTKSCASCKLVSYCSAQCQKEHWKTHKQDCKNVMRTEDWLPDWASQGRQPSFMDNTPGRESLSRNDPNYGKSLAVGVSLWGNTPAMDLLNLPKNENDVKRGYSIAFPACGDLRHLVKTVNNLPADFTGSLSVVLNDGNPYVTTRNLTILAILAKVQDEKLAADIALHYWYSTYMPTEYHFHIAHAVACWADEGGAGETFSLGSRSSLVSVLSPSSRHIFAFTNTAAMPVEEAQQECDRVKHSAGRKDLRDRFYYKLKPSHRVAYQEFRRFGILLPFGAVNHHFNFPNASLFSVDGRWLQSDFAEPLNGWDVKEVLDAGKRHGANSEDIYGCLYFYITERLRMFVHRLRTFDISITLFDMEACQLAAMLTGTGQDSIASTSQNVFPNTFDRITLSNITDENYVGFQKAVESWAPLLSQSRSAVLVAYFMNWIMLQRDGRVRDAGERASRDAMSKYMDKNKTKERSMNDPSDRTLLVKKTAADMPHILGALDAFYDNSKPFQTYLEKRGLQRTLKKTKLTLRQNHTIVPHRIGLPLEAPTTALPYLSFPDEESWYNYGVLGGFTWVERFVELGRE